MRPRVFRAEVVVQMERDRFEHPHPRVQHKMEVLWLWSHGLAADEIARLGGVSRRTAERSWSELLRGGLAATRPLRGRGPTSEWSQHRTSLEQEFRVQPLADPLGITRLYLPSYSPHLNRIERLGKFVK